MRTTPVVWFHLSIVLINIGLLALAIKRMDFNSGLLALACIVWSGTFGYLRYKMDNNL